MLKRKDAASSEPLKKSALVVEDEGKGVHSGSGTAHDESDHRQTAKALPWRHSLPRPRLAHSVDEAKALGNRNEDPTPVKNAVTAPQMVLAVPQRFGGSIVLRRPAGTARTNLHRIGILSS
jgi:hypothetical protein